MTNLKFLFVIVLTFLTSCSESLGDGVFLIDDGDCGHTDLSVNEIPVNLPERIRFELENKITPDSIVGHIGYQITHPLNSENCEPQYDEFIVSAEVKLAKGIQNWVLEFVLNEKGHLWCRGCYKSNDQSNRLYIEHIAP